MFKYCALIRLFFSMVTARLNVFKAAKDFDKIIRFGLASACYRAVYKLMRRLLVKLAA